MPVQIRTLLVDDAEYVERLSHQLGYSIGLEETKTNLEVIYQHPDHGIFAATIEEKPVAWIHVFRALQVESPPFCEIRGLVVDENFRRLGIGAMLINVAKAWAKEKNLPLLRLRCNTIRLEAHVFYAMLGFTEKKQQKVFELLL
jgi:GNAT superfamily N-acetyltransferase